MSLILEALRKLEREKPATDRGIVVMTTAGLTAEKRQVPPWVLLAAGLAAGLGLAFLVIEKRGAAPSPTTPTTLAPVAVPTPATSVAPWLAPLSSAPRPSLARTPAPSLPLPAPSAETTTTRPPRAAASPKPSAAPALVLQAISSRDGQPVALINDRVLREGDSVDGVRIVRIGDADVEIEKDGVRSVLRF